MVRRRRRHVKAAVPPTCSDDCKWMIVGYPQTGPEAECMLLNKKLKHFFDRYFWRQCEMIVGEDTIPEQTGNEFEL